MIRSLTPKDAEACMALAERVGWPKEREKWQLLFEQGPGFGVSAEDGALRAMVMLPEFVELRFVAMMVVSPSDQGQGLGRVLLEHALAKTQGVVALYATEAGRPLYERLGFVEQGGVVRYIGVLDGEAAALPPDPKETWNEDSILGADRAAFGYDRASLLRTLLARGQGVFTDDAGGFVLSWWNGAVTVLGPVVAQDEAHAIALVDRALANARGPVRIDVDVRFLALGRHVVARGLSDRGFAPLMVRGAAGLRGARERYFAIALQAFG